VDSWQNCCLPLTVRTIHKMLSSIKQVKVGRRIPMLCIRSIVDYINIYSRIVIQLNMYVKIITSSGFKSTILTDFVQGSFGFRFALADAWNFPEVHLFTGSCRLLRRLFDYARGSTQNGKKNRSRIYDLGVVPTRGNNIANSLACHGRLVVRLGCWETATF
jgi:hypothetical protein